MSWRKEMECRLDRITVHYEVRGEGRAFLALHGWPLDHRAVAGAFEPIFEKRQHWRRIYPDLPGMGKTEGPEWLVTQDQVLSVLTDFIGRVIPNGQFAVAGLSYGGLLAQGLVHRLADRMDGLLLLVPSMGPEETRDLPSHCVLHREPIDFEGVADQNISGFKNLAVVQTQEHLEAWKRDIIPGVKVADDKFLGRLRKNYAFSFDIAALPKPFTKPSLFLHGRQDNICGYRDAWKVLESYPRASYVVLDRAGHSLQMEQPKLFEALTGEWLDRVEEAAHA
ncbi:MAG: alpha/beta hydrolase [Candidatus Bathyarchaeia archaeon]|jgi:pimeloyl-ACP methyl ester carboxylesterase